MVFGKLFSPGAEPRKKATLASLETLCDYRLEPNWTILKVKVPKEGCSQTNQKTEEKSLDIEGEISEQEFNAEFREGGGHQSGQEQ